MTANNFQTEQNTYQDFIGRRALVSKIYARIGAGRPQSVSIVGDYKIGKTALLGYLAHVKTKNELLINPDNYIFITIFCRTEKPLTLESFTAMARLYPYLSA
jgi:hypothetical protein